MLHLVTTYGVGGFDADSPTGNVLSVTTAERDDDDQWWVVTRGPVGETVEAHAADAGEVAELDAREAAEFAPAPEEAPADPVAEAAAILAQLPPAQLAALLAALQGGGE